MFDAIEPEPRYLKALGSIEATMNKCKCPLSDEQRIILSGALAVWLVEPALIGANQAPGITSRATSTDGRAQGFDRGTWPFPRAKKDAG